MLSAETEIQDQTKKENRHRNLRIPSRLRRRMGQISFDFENGTSEIVRLADWDTMKTNRFANKAIAYLLSCENEKLPKETIVAFEL